MKVTIILSYIFFFVLSAGAQQSSVLGVWKTIDDQTGEAKSHVKIYEKNGKLYGKVTKLLIHPADSVCENCTGDKKNKRVLGMEVIRDMEQDNGKFTGGYVFDPAMGREFKCHIWLESPNKLAVRGYLGMPSLGRTQFWERVE